MARRKTRASLVTQYLEGISRTALAEYQQFFRDSARRRNGVYALYLKKQLYYVGLARDLRGRLKQHLGDRHGHSWDRFSLYLTIGEEHIRELESLVLRIVRPSGNKQMGKFLRAENLRRRFAAMARQDARDRLAIVLGNDLGVAGKPLRGMETATGRRGATLAKYVDGPLRLRASYKGKALKARVRRDGVIFFAGKKFASPSTAALHALPTRRAINGWWFWKYERAPGDWVRLRELRK
jgi:Restriction Enzyme Adenine Methylase Associated